MDVKIKIPRFKQILAISISGTYSEGNTITATILPNYLTGVTYQWYRTADTTTAGTAISEATNSTYTITSSEAGNYIYCVATCNSLSKQSNYSDLIHGWIAWTDNMSNSACYPSSISASYNVPADVIVTNIAASYWIQNHSPDSGCAKCTPYIKWNGNTISSGSLFGTCTRSTEYSSLTYNGSLTNGTIVLYSEQVFPTGWCCGCSATLTGTQYV